MEQNKAVFFLQSQPPTIGEVLSVISQIDNYDKLYICINSKSSVMPIAKTIAIWYAILKPYGAKTVIVSYDFYSLFTLSSIPKKFSNCKILTKSQKLFVHLSAINVNVDLIGTPSGFEDIFEQTAYRQSIALYWLKNIGK